MPAGLRPGVSAGAAGVLLGLLVWFGAELIGGGRQVGLAERVLARAQAVWPLAVVLACRWSQSRARMRHKSPPRRRHPRIRLHPGAGLVAMTVIRRWARRPFKALGSVARQSAVAQAGLSRRAVVQYRAWRANPHTLWLGPPPPGGHYAPPGWG